MDEIGKQKAGDLILGFFVSIQLASSDSALATSLRRDVMGGCS